MANTLSRILAGKTGRDAAAEEEARRAAAAQAAEEEDEDEAEGENDEEQQAAEEEDEDEAEDEGDEEQQAADPRARIKAILAAAEAKGREALAQHLAFETDMSPASAIAVLKASPAPTKGRLSAAMDSLPQPRLGPGAGAGPGDETVEQAAARLAGYVNTQRRTA